MTQTQLSKLEEIKKLDKLFLTPNEVASILGCSGNDIRGAARDRPDLLGFPVMIYGSRTKIPRIPFIKFWTELPPKCSKECSAKGIFAQGIESEDKQ